MEVRRPTRPWDSRGNPYTRVPGDDDPLLSDSNGKQKPPQARSGQSLSVFSTLVTVAALLVAVTALIVGSVALRNTDKGLIGKISNLIADNCTMNGGLTATNVTVLSTTIIKQNVHVGNDLIINGTIRQKLSRPIPRWEPGYAFHENIQLEQNYVVIAEQDVLLQNLNNVTSGNYILVAGTTINNNLLPSSIPVGGVDSIPVGAGAYVAEELWLTYSNQEFENDILGRVVAVSADLTTFVISTPSAMSVTATNLFFGGTILNPYKLKRIRLQVMPFPAWVLNMDNKGNAIVMARYAVNANKNSKFYLTAAYLADNGTDWIQFEPVLSDGPNLRNGDHLQYGRWNMANLTPGRLYSVLPVVPTENLVTLIGMSEPFGSPFFNQELARSAAPFRSTTFRMPYNVSHVGDVRMAFHSCGLGPVDRAWKLMNQNDPYDFMVSLGDFDYVPFAGQSLLSFNLPNNAGSALGFASGYAYQMTIVIIGPPTNFVIWDSVPNVVAINPLVVPLVVNSTNNLFLLDGKQYTIPSATYTLESAVAAGIQTVLGANFTVSVTGSSRLNITRNSYSEFQYQEQYKRRFLLKSMSTSFSNQGQYVISDDNEINSDWQGVSLRGKYQLGTSAEATMSAAIAANATARLFRVNYAPLSTTPTVITPIKSSNIDVALLEFQRMLPTTFVDSNTWDNRTGHVRWGQDVEVIKLDSAAYRNATTGLYQYYGEEGKFMRDDQLNFFIDRITMSTARVKIVLYSRVVAQSFSTLDEINQYRNKYIEVANGMGFANASQTGELFDKVYRFVNSKFANGHLEWFSNTFIPALSATNAKNVIFVSAGSHYGVLSKLQSGSSHYSFHATALGSQFRGGPGEGHKYGQSSEIAMYAQGNGYNDIVVSPTQNTITFNIHTILGSQSKTIPIE